MLNSLLVEMLLFSSEWAEERELAQGNGPWMYPSPSPAYFLLVNDVTKEVRLLVQSWNELFAGTGPGCRSAGPSSTAHSSV